MLSRRPVCLPTSRGLTFIKITTDGVPFGHRRSIAAGERARSIARSVVRQAIESLSVKKEELFITIQNVAEFWNVATRPATENGLGLPTATVCDLLERLIEPLRAVLFERDTLYTEFKRLALKYEVRGKQTHDARLTAQMLVWNVDKILTLNDRDFRRYEPEGIAVVHPDSLVNERGN